MKFLIISLFILISISTNIHAQHMGRHFSQHRTNWHNGHWTQGHYSGRVGWWWVVGPTWYFYSRPFYPYPSPYNPPNIVVVPQTVQPVTPAPVQNWYFCEASKEYYPYVSNCPGGWKVIPIVPSDEKPNALPKK
ncbi:MAG: hypothetical protein Q7U04_08435 [Bacteriovorax sp.]|nr:hypothetical protein [Bacteriovorax sp.]